MSSSYTYPTLVGRALSGREKEVITLLAEGYSNPEIGERLHLSPKTIKTHLARISAKLEARSRAHIVAISLRRDLL